MVRLPEFGAHKKEEKEAAADAFAEKFKDREIVKARWSSDTLHVRSAKPLGEQEITAFLATTTPPLEVREIETASVKVSGDEGAPIENEYKIAVYGLDRAVQGAIAEKTQSVVTIKQVDGISAKAGKELRDDGIKSLLYAIALIMLYIAFRFDFRYGPGTVAALLHDAVLVIGVFAVTWTEFSLTTVAAVLTVIGYSMNDTVVVFDRIRENEHKLKDKKLDRVINISVNETLSRTILLSLTTFSTTFAMNVLGTGLVKNFAFAMNVGIIVGTYSSIFVAAPILLVLHEKYFSKRPAPSRRQRPMQETTAES
jgi:preprotein translocase subunit SecF